MARKTNQLNYQKISREVVEKLTSAFNVDEIILFGSYARGEETDESDIDIAVISPEIKASGIMCKNVSEVKTKAGILEPGLQLFAFESNSFYNEDYFDPGFIREIKKTGEVLYSKLKKIICHLDLSS